MGKLGQTGSVGSGRQEQGESPQEMANWYCQMYKNRSLCRSAPSHLRCNKESSPYCLTIWNAHGFSLHKKSAQSTLFLSVSGMLVSAPFDILGVPFHYQSEVCFGRDESRWDVPMPFYFHSRIDKNNPEIFLLLSFKAVELRESLVESVTEVGLAVITDPFIEEERKTVPILKDLTEPEFCFLSSEAKLKLTQVNSSFSLTYSLESVLELKKLTKFTPQNCIFSHQDAITGIRGGHLEKGPGQLMLKEGRSMEVTMGYLMVDIPDQFEADLRLSLTRLFPSEKMFEIKSRRLVVGYHNEYCLVNGNSRKLQLHKKYTSGSMSIGRFEFLKEGEVIKVPYFFEGCGVLALGLVFEVNDRILQVACYYLTPNQEGEDLSEEMLTGPALGLIDQVVPVNSKAKPTIMAEYECDLRVGQTEHFEETRREVRGQEVDEEVLKKERERLKQEIEAERVEIEREKEKMEREKAESYSNLQSEFEKRFEAEKLNLLKRQQMLQAQYKEQVEREVKEKFDLEQEIKKIHEKLRTLEDDTFHNDTHHPDSHRPPEPHRPSSPPFHSSEQPLSAPLRQRVDPAYLVEPENPMSVKKVREVLERGVKVSSELVRESEEQFHVGSKFTFSFISVVWSGGLAPPKDIYLVIRFFNKEEFKTDCLSYLESGEDGYRELVQTSHFRQGFEHKEPSYSFRVDPSEYDRPHSIQKDLTSYLCNNCAIVDVFCGSSHMYVGQLNVRLKEVLRGAKSQVMTAKQLSLVRLKDKETLGTMQLLIRNEQVSCREPVSVQEEKRVRDLKKKVVSNGPIVITPEDRFRTTEPGRPEAIRRSNLPSRQQLRIKKFKEERAMKTFTETAKGFQQLEDPQKQAVLSQIVNFKEQKMNDYIKGVYTSLLNEQINLSAHFGKAATFPYLFQNSSPAPASYRVTILQAEDDLLLVKEAKEWRFFVGEHNYVEPKRYNMIGQKDTFFLQPGESVPLIFKYLSLRQGSAQRVVNVTICKEESNWMAAGFSLLVQMHEPIINHSYILYEPGEQMVDIIVPVVYTPTDSTSSPKKLHLTHPDPSTQAHWLNPYEILVRLRTPPIMQKITFNLLLYHDQYLCDLSENWLIQVFAYEGVCSYFRSDFNTKFKITMPWSAVPPHLGLLSLDRAASSLRLFSSTPALVFKENLIELEGERREEGGCQIWCELLGSENSRKCAEISCVSGEDNQLIYGWTVTVYPYVSRY